MCPRLSYNFNLPLRQFRVKKTVVVIFAAIDNINAAKLGIVEDKEIVTQQFHLVNGFLFGHWIHEEPFDPYNFSVLFVGDTLDNALF